MSLITVGEINALNAGGGLSDADLQAVIDREEAELVQRFGSHAAARTELFDGGDGLVALNRRLSAVSSVTEYSELGGSGTVLVANTDYYADTANGFVIRLPEGSFWGRKVSVTYTPVSDANRRKQVLVELVRLGVSQDTGATVKGLGYAIEGGPKDTQAWQAARESLYARLAGLWSL